MPTPAWRRRFARPGDPTRVVVRRCLAFVIDAVDVVLILFVSALLTPATVDVEGNCPTPVPDGKACFQYNSEAYLVDGRNVVRFLIVFVILISIVLIVAKRILGTTIGKWLLRVRVVDALGRPVTWRRSLVRTLVLPADVFTVLLPIGLWLALLTPGHRRIGDLLAGTWVVRADAVGRSPIADIRPSPDPRHSVPSPP